MNSSVTLKSNPKIFGQVYQLPSSKSISNRALILNALSGNRSDVRNLSSARDTALMRSLIGSTSTLIDVMDAGTTMRFLTAYFAITNQKKTMTGTERMKQRPIGLLVDALRNIGADIEYRGQEGFPPIEIQGFESQKKESIEIPGNVSSQYISALMMVAPSLPFGLAIKLTGAIGSIPYIKMTEALMKEFGINVIFDNNEIKIKSGTYSPSAITVEADWSAASYWFAFVALASESKIILPNVSEKSLQGDRVIIDIMEKLGVKSVFVGENLELTKQKSAKHVTWDFRDCPDLAQTVLPVCAANGITGEFIGLESLLIKETDRIAALKNELAKIGALLSEPEKGKWKLDPGNILSLNKPIETYHDHRMAMGFAPWASLVDVTILAPEVVNKSYPGFWDDVKSVGIQVL